MEVERWRCIECGEDAPCEISIYFSNAKLSDHTKRQDRFRDKRCPCKESTLPIWHKIPDTRCKKKNECPIDCSLTYLGVSKNNCKYYKPIDEE